MLKIQLDFDYLATKSNWKNAHISTTWFHYFCRPRRGTTSPRNNGESGRRLVGRQRTSAEKKHMIWGFKYVSLRIFKLGLFCISLGNSKLRTQKAWEKWESHRIVVMVRLLFSVARVQADSLTLNEPKKLVMSHHQKPESMTAGVVPWEVLALKDCELEKLCLSMNCISWALASGPWSVSIVNCPCWLWHVPKTWIWVSLQVPLALQSWWREFVPQTSHEVVSNGFQP